METVAGTFRSIEEARRAVSHLRHAGFSPAQFSVTTSLMISNAQAGTESLFTTDIVQLDAQGTGPFGPLWIRQDTARPSLGLHAIMPSATRPGFDVSSFFDVFMELSTDGVNYIPADRSLRLQAASPPSGPGTLFIMGVNAAGIALNWLGAHQLQTAKRRGFISLGVEQR